MYLKPENIKRGRIHILFLFCFLMATSSASSQGVIHKVSSKPEEQTELAGKYIQLIKLYRYTNQDSALYFVRQGLDYTNQAVDRKGLANILIQLGMIYDNQGEFDSSLLQYEKALKLFRDLNYNLGISSALIRIGVVALREGKYDTAIKYFLEALKLSEKLKDKQGIMEAYYSISWAWLDQKKYDKALEYLNIAETYNQQLPFSNISLNILNHFGVIFRETNQLKKAKAYLEKGIQKSSLPEYNGLNITLINNLASVYAKEGHKEKAIQLQKDALARSREIGNYLRELQTLLGLSKSYGKEAPNIAIYYLKQAIALAKEKKVPRQEIRFLNIITGIYKAEKNYKAALESKEREFALSDTFFYQSTERNITALKAEYELSKSNARIKELDLINKKKALQLDHIARMQIFFYVGAGALFIILGLVYSQYKIKKQTSTTLKRKNASLLALINEKELLLKEVHHRVKNNLHTIISLLESQSAFLKDDALFAVQNSQHRIYAMSLIHQKLYQLDQSTKANMAVYIPELLHYLQDSFAVKQRLHFHVCIDNIELDVSQAIPVGLIMNEAITNAIKYAYPHNSQGELEIHMENKKGSTVCFWVADGGIGLPRDWEKSRMDTLGFKLMKGLSAEIKASFTIINGKGTKVMLQFEKLDFTTNTQTELYTI